MTSINIYDVLTMCSIHNGCTNCTVTSKTKINTFCNLTQNVSGKPTVV